MLKDPRSHKRYRTASARWIAALPNPTPCCLCGEDIDTTLPRTVPAGPTVEHRLPVRTILASAQTQQQALDMACDQSLWDAAHRRCQDRQGAAVTNGRVTEPEPSRAWW